MPKESQPGSARRGYPIREPSSEEKKAIAEFFEIAQKMAPGLKAVCAGQMSDPDRIILKLCLQLPGNLTLSSSIAGNLYQLAEEFCSEQLELTISFNPFIGNGEMVRIDDVLDKKDISENAFFQVSPKEFREREKVLRFYHRPHFLSTLKLFSQIIFYVLAFGLILYDIHIHTNEHHAVETGQTQERSTHP